MAVLLLDALANRAAYMLRELGPFTELTGTRPIERPVRDNLEFILDLMAQHPPAQPTADGVKEIYALRGVLAHNYVWLVQFAERDEPPSMAILGAKLTEAFGNVLFAGVVDGLVSRSLRLNFVPDLINRVDATTVLEEVWQTILFLSSVRGASVSADALGHLRVAGQLMRLPDVVQALRTSAGLAGLADTASPTPG